MDDDSSLEPVFIAANVREVAEIERLLSSEGIDYVARPETFVRASVVSSSEFTGLLFEVLAGQAPYCRKLRLARGMRAGVIPAEGEAKI